MPEDQVEIRRQPNQREPCTPGDANTLKTEQDNLTL